MQRTILIVDDNRLYRQAVKRNLVLRNYRVLEADNANEALALLEKELPQVVVTDLDMRTRTEGLDLIKELNQKRPELPVILISAVGTFDEGALAKEYGAMYVISKSRVGNEIEHLLRLIESAITHQEKEQKILADLEQWKDTVEPVAPETVLPRLREIMNDDTLSSLVKSEAFDILYTYSLPTLTIETKTALQQFQQQVPGTLPEQIEQEIEHVLAQYSELQEESKENILDRRILVSISDGFRYWL